MSLIGNLYKISRMFGKTASALNDVKILSSGDINKISKRIVRKTVNKTAFKTANKINRNIR